MENKQHFGLITRHARPLSMNGCFPSLFMLTPSRMIIVNELSDAQDLYSLFHRPYVQHSKQETHISNFVFSSILSIRSGRTTWFAGDGVTTSSSWLVTAAHSLVTEGSSQVLPMWIGECRDESFLIGWSSIARSLHGWQTSQLHLAACFVARKRRN